MRMKTKLFMVVLSLSILLAAPFLIPAISSQAAPLSASQSDKSDDECTGHETIGRCADKCPSPQFVRGFDKDTGAAICGYVTGCPYGDSVPLGPECDRLAPQSQPAVQLQPIETAPTNTDFTGK